MSSGSRSGALLSTPQRAERSAATEAVFNMSLTFHSWVCASAAVGQSGFTAVRMEMTRQLISDNSK